MQVDIILVTAIVAAGVAAAGMVALLVLRPSWSGFAGKTLWEWITVLAVPVMVAAATIAINTRQGVIASERAAEDAMTAYVDRITTLVLDPAIRSDTALLAAVGRAQTSAALAAVDGPRRGRVLRFLHEVGLLHEFAATLDGQDLRRADLKGLNLSEISFEGARLDGAELEGADLTGADLEDTDLSGADLKDARLVGAEFEGADLSGAQLRGADLRGADLSRAEGLSEEQLDGACLDDTTLLPVTVDAADVLAEADCRPPDERGEDDDDDDDEPDDD